MTKNGENSDSSNKSAKADNPQVRLPPPLVFGLPLFLCLYIQSNWFEGSIGPLLPFATGLSLAGAGVIAAIYEAWRHESSGSNVEPWKPTTLILTDGLYRYSRNPIYVAMVLIYSGVAIAAGSWIAFLLLPLCIFILRYHVIAREEVYLEDKFGDIYLEYKATVRRWI
ncbi:MAG: isoprenylcysteine carboxylmethyltransferase family protein [Sneathiellales bacterium]|nr:isoprenylcysteine carboxylmethyltransferase family protein [Sneathiellales bacterium]